MFKKGILSLLLVLSLQFASFAQESTEEALPEATQEPISVVVVQEDAAVLGTIPDPNPVETNAINTLTADALFLPFAATLVTLLTAFLKMLLPFPAKRISLALNIGLWVTYVVSREVFGDTGQFEGAVQTLVTVLSALMGTTGTSYLAKKMYDTNREADTPVLGADRPRD